MKPKSRTPLVATLASALAAGGLHAASVCFSPAEPSDGRRMWAFEAGVAFITANTIDDLFAGEASLAGGAARGEVYSITAARRLGELKLELWGREFHPGVELPLRLGMVDEAGRSPFLEFNASFVVRWTEFPWNGHLLTTFATGVGLSYSEKVYQSDIDRHPGEHRSHLKFNWPIQLTFALPAYPDHQVTLFIAHQSGGHLFDEGGVNSVGFGYRRSF